MFDIFTDFPKPNPPPPTTVHCKRNIEYDYFSKSATNDRSRQGFAASLTEKSANFQFIYLHVYKDMQTLASVWGQEHDIQPKIFPHQTCKRLKITKMKQRTPNVVVAVAADV
jgi:hypothetical protein